VNRGVPSCSPPRHHRLGGCAALRSCKSQGGVRGRLGGALGWTGRRPPGFINRNPPPPAPASAFCISSPLLSPLPSPLLPPVVFHKDK
jgi:hypothetical protein